MIASGSTSYDPHICVFTGTSSTTEWVCRRCGNRLVLRLPTTRVPR